MHLFSSFVSSALTMIEQLSLSRRRESLASMAQLGFAALATNDVDMALRCWEDTFHITDIGEHRSLRFSLLTNLVLLCLDQKNDVHVAKADRFAQLLLSVLLLVLLPPPFRMV